MTATGTMEAQSAKRKPTGDLVDSALQTALSFQDLTVDYGDGRGLFAVSGCARRGEVLSLVGPNGAGKSTLIRSLALLLRGVSRGRVRYGDWEWDYSKGMPPEAEADAVRRRVVGVVLQRSEPFPHMRVGKFVQTALKLGSGLSDGAAWKRAREAMSQFDVADREDAFADELSGGLQQRVMLAQATALRRPVLILDEATGALDADWEERVRSMLRQFAASGGTVINISHRMGFMRRVSDRIMLFGAGRVVAHGTLQEVMNADLPATLRAYLENS